MLPQEFKHYVKYPFITSLDTSNPIIHGMLGIRYKDHGLDKKETVLLADLIESDINVTQWMDIFHNIAKFKEFTNSYT